MDFRLLGPFEVWVDGAAIPLGARRQRAVLALLAMHPGEVLSTDRIVEEIWAENAPPSAVRTVHAYVSRLRACLRDGSKTGAGSDVLVSREPGYLLDVDPMDVDAVRFEHGVVQASVLLQEGDPQKANVLLQESLSLWRGTALADFAYEGFAAGESERLTARRLDAIELRIDTDLALVRHGQVVSELEALVVSHPMRERFWAQLMVALYRSGRQSDALAVYGRVRRMLIEELGIEPGPELRRLERLVLEQSQELAWEPPSVEAHAPAAGAAPAPAARRTEFAARWRNQATDLLPFVDRVEHFETLDRLLLQGGPGGQPGLVLILGSPGCGKSRLLTEFGRRAVEQAVLVASGSAERESSLPYGPFADAVRDIVDAAGPESLARVGHLRQDLAWLLPELGPPPTIDSENLGLARGRVVEAVLQLLATAGRSEPLLILVDDAHRLGEGAMALMRAVLERRWDRPVLVVVACRSSPSDWPSGNAEPLVELLKREGTVTMEVDRLRTTDLSDLVDRLDLALPDLEGTELALRLGAQTGGIPLLVREVLAIWDSNAEVVPSRGERFDSISPLIQTVIGQRLSGLSIETRRLLEAAATIGMQFDVSTVAPACGLSPASAVDLLDEAVGAGIVVETGHFDRFAFDHGLIRDVLASSVSTSRKVRIHSTTSEAFASRGSAIDAAQHALAGVAALGVPRTVELTLHGADAALASLQFELARSLCSTVLDDLAEPLPPELRVDLLIRVGRAEALAGHTDAAEEAWRAGAEVARSIEDHERLALVALATDLLSRNVDASDLRWALLTEAMEHSGPEWTRLRLLVASQWLNEAATPAHHAATPELAAEIVDQSRRLGDTSVLVAACGARHAWSRFGYDPKRREWSREFLEVAEELGHDDWLFRAHLARLIDAIVDADGDAADQSLELLRETGGRLRTPRDLWFRELATATCARLRGDFELADEHISALSSLGEQYGISDTAAVVGAVAYTNAYHHGGLNGLRPPLDLFAAMYPYVPAWVLASGVAALSDGDLEAASEILGRGMAPLSDRAQDGLWLTGVCLAVEIAARLESDGATLDELARMLTPHTGQYVIVGTLTTEYGPVDRCLGLLEFARGNLAEASAYFASAVTACQRLRAGPWELLTREDWRAVEQAAGGQPRDWWSELPDVARELPRPAPPRS